MAEIEKVVSILRQQCLWEIHGFDEVGSTWPIVRLLDGDGMIAFGRRLPAKVFG